MKAEVGYMAASIIEEMLKDCIIACPLDIDAHNKYITIKEYNKTSEEEKYE